MEHECGLKGGEAVTPGPWAVNTAEARHTKRLQRGQELFRRVLQLIKEVKNQLSKSAIIRG